jgi:hypothetical protein
MEGVIDGISTLHLRANRAEGKGIRLAHLERIFHALITGAVGARRASVPHSGHLESKSSATFPGIGVARKS